MGEVPVIAVEGLHKQYRIGKSTVRALDGVDIAFPEGETVAVVGESGSGKTTLANLILGLEPPSAGRMTFRGTELGLKRPTEMCRHIQVVQQNPISALNPRKTVKYSVELPLVVHGLRNRRQRRDRVAELLEMVGLSADFVTRYPATLSGGQRQRVALARALAAEPDVLVLDEPTSALDVSVQAKVLSTFVALQAELGLSYIFITHDLSVVRTVASRVVVLYRGKVVEEGPTSEVFANPRHRYTTMLLSSIPVVSEEDEALKPAWPWGRMMDESGDSEVAGCNFAPRCPYSGDPCRGTPALGPEGAHHRFACHFPSDIGQKNVGRA